MEVQVMSNDTTTPVSIRPEAMVDQLRTLRAQIPEYSQLSNADAATLRRAANLDGSFVQAAINALGASEEVRNALRKTPEALLQQADEAARWSAVEDELRAILKGVIA